MPFVLCEDPSGGRPLKVHADACAYFVERAPATSMRWYTGLRSSHEALAVARRLAGPQGARLALCCLRGRVRPATVPGRLTLSGGPVRKA